MPETAPIVSPDIALTTGATTYTWAHGLPFVPKNYRAVIICQVPDRGCAAGDEVDVIGLSQSGAGTIDIMLVADITNLTLVQRATVQMFTKTAGVAAGITEANWKLRFYIWP